MAKKNLKKGIFITFEGIEGCGKSTHSKLVLEYLKKKGYSCVITREPGGTQLGEELRRVLLRPKGIKISDLTELFLFEACRCQIVKDIIGPALRRKDIVICDRFSDATICYQGYGGGIDINIIKTLNKIAAGLLEPDLTIILDIDTKKGLKRASIKGADRMELKDIAYHKRVRAGYLKLAKKFPQRIRVVKVDGEITRVQTNIRREVDNVLQQH